MTRANSDWIRRLALERVQELRRAGWSRQEIAQAYGWRRCGAMAKPVFDNVFLNALDNISQGIAFYDADGALLHHNAWLQQTSQLPVGHQLAHTINDFVGMLRQLMRSREDGLGGHVERLATIEVAAELRPIRRVTGSVVGYDLFGTGPTILIGVETTSAHTPTPELARQRFGLTRAETRVAHYIAEGMSTSDIARVLQISPHTVRRHTEKVLSKLNATTRGEVCERFRGTMEPDEAPA